MKKITLLLLFVFISSISWAQVLLINELDPDSPGLDTAEFIELKSQTPNFSTDGYILVFFNGSYSGGDSSYLVIDLNGLVTDNNGLLVIGGSEVMPYPQMVIPDNLIQNGEDAVGIYYASVDDFPDGTLATQVNLIDAMVYGTNDPDALGLLALLGETIQHNDSGTNANPKSIQRFVDEFGAVTFSSETPTPRRENDGSGIPVNPIAISVAQTEYLEGESFDIVFTAETAVTTDLTFNISLDNYAFNSADYSGNTTLTIPAGQNTISTTIAIIEDSTEEGDEVAKIQFLDLVEPMMPFNNYLEVRIIDIDYTVAPFGTPINSTTGVVQSTQPDGYYDSLDGLAGEDLRQAMQDIIADPNTVRAHSYADVFTILMDADQNPENSSQVWLVYLEEGRSKLDLQTSSINTNKWNREHTFPTSRAGYYSIESDRIASGIDVYWTSSPDSLRHGYTDAHALRAADASENSSRGNKHFGQYVGPTATLGGFRGDVARGVLFMDIRYNALEIVDGYPNVTGQLGDLQTILDWHRNDQPDDFEMNRNNIIYNWQKNRNPFIDHPLLVEYIWGNKVGDIWNQSLSIGDPTELNIAVYPNPTTGRVYISGLSAKTDIEVYSVEGKLLKRFSSVEDHIDLDVASGLYILKMNLGEATTVKKILVD